MADKINAVMATEVALNVAPAQRSLRALKQSVGIVNKAVEAQAKNFEVAGDSYKAVQAKAEGLTTVMNKQQAVIDALETKQREQVNIAQNQKQILADLSDKIRDAKQARNQEAEEVGKQSDKYKQLTEQIKIYEKQQRDAKNVDRGLNSTTRQLENARAQMARYTAEQKQAVQAQRQMSAGPITRISGAIQRANDHLKETNERVGGLHGVLMGTFAGNALSNAASSAWNLIKGGIVGATKAGIDFDKQQQVMQASWTTLMGSAGKADKMRKSIINMSNALGQPVELTDELSQQFYHVFDNQPETEKLTKSFLTMGDAIGLSSDRLQQVGMDFTHMLSSSHLQLGDLNQITDAFPMFGNALLKYEQQVQHSSKLTMAQLRKQISAGKISSHDAEAVMNQLGAKYKQASDNLMGTLPGMARQIKAKSKQLMGDATQSMVQAQSPIYKAVSKWVSDPQTDTVFKRLGSKVNQSMQTVMKAFGGSGSTSQIADRLNSAVNSIGNGIQRLAQFIAQHANTIKASFGLIKSIGVLSFKLLGAAIKSVIGLFSAFVSKGSRSGKQSQSTAQQIRTLSNWLDRLSKNRVALKILGSTLAGIFVVAKVVRFARFIKTLSMAFAGPLVGGVSRAISIFTKLGGASRVLALGLRAIPVVGIAVAVAGLVAWFVRLYTHSQKFRDFCAGIVKIAKTVLMQVVKFMPFTSMIYQFTKLYTHNKKFREFCNAIFNTVKDVFGRMRDWLKNLFGWIGKKLGKVYNFIADVGRSDSFSNPSHKYASGTTGTTEDQVALVNDAQNQNYREMMLYKNKLFMFGNKRNQLAYIPKGAEVIDGEASKKIANRYGLNHFASGSSELSSWINGLNDEGRGNRSEVIQSFMKKLNKQFTRQLKKFEEQIAKAQSQAQQSIQKANQTFQQRMQKARQSMQQRIAKAQQSMQQRMQKAQQSMSEKLAKAHQRLVERLSKIAQSSAQRQAKAVQTRDSKLAKGQASMKARQDKARQSAQTKTDKANQTWAQQQKKYKDNPKMLAKAQKRHQERLAKIQAMLSNQLDNAGNSYYNTYDKAWDSYRKTMKSISDSVGKQTSTAQSSIAKSNASARSSFAKATENAKNSFTKTTQNAHNSFNITSQKARQSAQTAIAKAQQTEARKVDLANLNIKRLKDWKQNNIDQLYAGMSTYAHGGIATSASIFGEDGAEAAIPLDSMKQGDAWTTLQKVIDYYAGNGNSSSSAQPTTSTDDRAIEALNSKFDMMIELMKTFISGQSAQIQATRHIQGYDANKSFSDFSEHFADAVAANLTN